MSKLQEKPSAALIREHPALQKRNILTFLWVMFALLDPDPQQCPETNLF
jgi:hypothetical protein